MAGDARARLIRLLRSAHAGELAAGFAYRGHWKSASDPAERERIHQIEEDEWHHRRLVAGILKDLGSGPNRIREAIFWTIGRTLGLLCHVSGWFLPMYAAGRLERRNIVEYEDAARIATACGEERFIDCLLTMAEVEWDHELYFRSRVTGHRMLRFFPLWDAAPAKETIRASNPERSEGSGRLDGTHTAPPAHPDPSLRSG